MMSKRRPFTTLNNILPNSRAETVEPVTLGNFTVKEKTVASSGRRVVSIYILGTHFDDLSGLTYDGVWPYTLTGWHNTKQGLSGWQKSDMGKAIIQFLMQPRFSDCMKCIFIDYTFIDGEIMPMGLRSTTLDCIINWTHDLNQPENIKCYTVCFLCGRYCTVNFNFEKTIPRLQCQAVCCPACIEEYKIVSQ